MTPAPLLALRGVGRTYAGPPAVQALQPTDLTIAAGEYVSVVGPSGSGKSTLMHVLGLLDRPSVGTYLLGGTDVTALDDEARAAVRSTQIGFVFQAYHLLEHRTVVENVELAFLYAPGATPERRAASLEALERVGLGERVGFSPRLLSGGERQRVAVARAVVGRPQLLLCDEPTGNLDSDTGDAILDLFDELHATGITLVVVTHDPRVAARAQRTIRLSDGVVVEDTGSASGAPAPLVAGAPPAGRTRIRIRDLLGEAFVSLWLRPGRTALTALGTVLGLTALIATVGITQSAGRQIVSELDRLAATEVTVEPAPDTAVQEGVLASPLPWDAERRLARLNGVVAAGAVAPVDLGGLAVRAPPNPPQPVAVFAASPGLFDALRATVARGRVFDAGHNDRGDRVAVLGAAAARQLGVERVANQPSIFVGEEPFVVVGILADVPRRPELLAAVVVPERTAQSRLGVGGPATVHVDVAIGAAAVIGEQAPLALNPVAPDQLRVSQAPEPRRVRESVEDQVNVLLVAVGLIALLVGGLGIANVTFTSVLQRTPEIGLRRALGALRRHVALQFLVESATIGLLGGIAGSAGGVIATVAISDAQGWVPVLDLVVPLLAPLAGIAIGLGAGLYPALRAARIEPVAALRSAA